MQTKVYVADVNALNDEKVFNYFYNLMSSDRQNKIDAYSLRKDKNLSLGAGILLKVALSKIGLNLNEQTIEYRQNQKPYLLNSSIYFNISHSQDKVMCVLADSEVGCDIEKIEDVNISVAKRYFNKQEYEIIKNQKQQVEKKFMFFRLWTLKESFLKITGLGGKLALDSFCFFFKEEAPEVLQNVNNKKYFFKEYSVVDGYAMACACEKDDFSDVEIIDLFKLYNNL